MQLDPVAAPGRPNEHCPNSPEQAAISNCPDRYFVGELTTSAHDLDLFASRRNE
jgi:hypothetical protein